MKKTGWKRVQLRLRKRALFTASVRSDLKAERDQLLKILLLAMADEWQRRARARMKSLSRAGKDAPDREALESSALAYASCAADLRRLAGAPARSCNPPCYDALTELGRLDPDCGLGRAPD